MFWGLLPIVAFFYAAVGHGGASGYMALMLLFDWGQEAIRPSALILNVGVSGLSFWQFWRSGYFRWRLFWPFALASVPAAYIGGMLAVSGFWYKKALGFLLLLPVLRLFGWLGKGRSARPLWLPLALVFGAAVGFVSGLIGIGGGIILSPLLLWLGWADVKESAAVSALFIFVNSCAGLLGLCQKGLTLTPEMGLMLILAAAGGFIGAWWGARVLTSAGLRKVLGGVLLLAAAKLILG